MSDTKFSKIKLKRGPYALARLDTYELGYATDKNCLIIGTPDGVRVVSSSTSAGGESVGGVPTEVPQEVLDHIKLIEDDLETSATLSPVLTELVTLVNTHLSFGEKVPEGLSEGAQIYSIYKILQVHLKSSGVILVKDTSRTMRGHVAYLLNIIETHMQLPGGDK